MTGQEQATLKVGVAGLGAMGAPMALNFHRRGLLRGVWNRSPARAEAVQSETGVAVADSPAALAAGCDLVVTCVSRDADVIAVVRGIAEGIRPGAVVADTSTTSRECAREAAKILEGKGAHFLDCPVSGGTEGARNGTLAMMVGGDEDVLERVRPALSAIAASIVRIGPTGSGQACKAVNQLMVAGIYEAVAEALAFGEAMGLDMGRVIDVISGGAASSWVLKHRGPSMVEGRYPLGFKVSLHHKDLEICRGMASATDGATLPVAERMLAHYAQLMAEGYGDEDVSAIYRLKRRDHGR
jgi:3-hydroxyisobutyrate dehydrogenase